MNFRMAYDSNCILEISPQPSIKGGSDQRRSLNYASFLNMKICDIVGPDGPFVALSSWTPSLIPQMSHQFSLTLQSIVILLSMVENKKL